LISKFNGNMRWFFLKDNKKKWKNKVINIKSDSKKNEKKTKMNEKMSASWIFFLYVVRYI